MAAWASHWLGVGLVTMLFPTAMLLLSLRWARAALADDYPDDIQAALPALSRAEQVRGWAMGTVFLLTLLGAGFYTTWSWLDADPPRGFLAAYAMAFATFALFAVIDLVIVDWLIICRVRPAWVVIPGTEDCAGWGDYGFHLKEQLSPKGITALVVLPAIIAGAATLLV